MQGKLVIIKVVGGQFVVITIWSIGQNIMYVTDEKNYDLLINNRNRVVPIGVPKEDVFEHDKAIKKRRLDKIKMRISCIGLWGWRIACYFVYDLLCDLREVSLLSFLRCHVPNVPRVARMVNGNFCVTEPLP